MVRGIGLRGCGLEGGAHCAPGTVGMADGARTSQGKIKGFVPIWHWHFGGSYRVGAGYDAMERCARGDWQR